ncbi:MAG TPA: hypothetical protein HA321_00775, partial [Halobacteriales archaeon]|nr:hypothetical protein [Halobacteriales archaeon]
PEVFNFKPQSGREVIDRMYEMGFEHSICAFGVVKGEFVEFSLDNK